MKTSNLLFLALLTSCSAKYGVSTGVSQQKYSEKATISSIVSSTSVTLPEYQSEGTGLFLGITEESDWFLTKISYFQNKYKDSKYSFSGVTVNGDLSESGIRTSLALKLWIFQPFFSFSSYASKYNIDGDVKKESYVTAGYGMDIEVPINETAFWFLGYEMDSFNNEAIEGSLTIDQTLSHSRIYTGIRFNIFDNSKGKK